MVVKQELGRRRSADVEGHVEPVQAVRSTCLKADEQSR